MSVKDQRMKRESMHLRVGSRVSHQRLLELENSGHVTQRPHDLCVKVVANADDGPAQGLALPPLFLARLVTLTISASLFGTTSTT